MDEEIWSWRSSPIVLPECPALDAPALLPEHAVLAAQQRWQDGLVPSISVETQSSTESRCRDVLQRSSKAALAGWTRTGKTDKNSGRQNNPQTLTVLSQVNVVVKAKGKAFFLLPFIFTKRSHC